MLVCFVVPIDPVLMVETKLDSMLTGQEEG